MRNVEARYEVSDPDDDGFVTLTLEIDVPRTYPVDLLGPWLMRQFFERDAQQPADAPCD